jgi:hypothetical protein
MKRHASPHFPGNETLRQTRKREWRKRKIRKVTDTPMRRTITQKFLGIGIAIAVIVMMIASVALINASEAPTKTQSAGLAGPFPCFETETGLLICDGTPAASPVVTPIETAVSLPTANPEIALIVELPSTGVGSTAPRLESGTHIAYVSSGYYKCNVYGDQWVLMVLIHHPTGTSVHYYDWNSTYWARTGYTCNQNRW